MARLRAPFVVTLSAWTATAVSALAACSSSDDQPPATADSSIDVRRDTTEPELDSGVPSDSGDAHTDATDADTYLPPNPTGCPKDDPGFGPFHQKCTLADTVRCTYRDECPLRPADAGGPALNVYSCHDDGSGPHWTLVSKPYAPDCPDVEPKAGDDCPCSPHMQYLICQYGSCEDFTATYSSCEGPEELEHAWHVLPISCNPPEPDGGFDVRDGD